MNSVVSKAWITLDPRFHSQNVIVLSFEVANDLAKGCFVVDLVAKARSIDDGQGDPCTFLIELKFYTVSMHALRQLEESRPTNGNGLDSHTFLEMRIRSIVSILLTEDSLSAKCIHESRSACCLLSRAHAIAQRNLYLFHLHHTPSSRTEYPS